MSDPRGLGSLHTEIRDPRTRELDRVPLLEMLRMMNMADQTVPLAVGQVLPAVGEAVRLVAGSLGRGGRLVYVGAGTSGRIGTLDASECPPTFDTDPDSVIAIIAGGPAALTRAVEGAEDDDNQAIADIAAAQIGPLDTVVGIAASGRTPYVVTSLRAARNLGASTVSVACNPDAPISREADVAIEIDTGPEVLTGSTRLKAGSAQKLVCNMITTGAMVLTGRVYQNLMVDMRPSNVKLLDRAERIVAEATGTDRESARTALTDSVGNTKVAIVSLLGDVSAKDAAEVLAVADGSVRKALVLIAAR